MFRLWKLFIQLMSSLAVRFNASHDHGCCMLLWQWQLTSCMTVVGLLLCTQQHNLTVENEVKKLN